MNEYLIITANPAAYTDTLFTAVVVMQDLGDGTFVVGVTNETNPLQLGDTLVTGIDPFTGIPVEPTNEIEYRRIRPLGNDEGKATNYLGYHKWAGAQNRQLGDLASPDRVMQLYPEDIAPIAIEFRPKYFDTNDPGWGFRAEITGGEEGRNPGQWSIGAYSDQECTLLLWTTLSFSLGPSEWQGEEAWYTESRDDVVRPDARQDWNVAALWGVAQKGYETMLATVESAQFLFWNKDQDEIPGPALNSAWSSAYDSETYYAP